MREHNHEHVLAHLCDELATPNGARLSGRFVSKADVEAELARRGMRLDHVAGGVWVATPADAPLAIDSMARPMKPPTARRTA